MSSGVQENNMAEKLLYLLVILTLANDIGPKYLDQKGFWPDCQYDPLAENWKYFGDSCIQNVHLWRYIVQYTVGNLVSQ